MASRQEPQQGSLLERKGVDCVLESSQIGGAERHAFLLAYGMQSAVHEFFETDALRANIENNRRDHVWQLLVLEEWRRQKTRWTLPARTVEVLGLA